MHVMNLMIIRNFYKKIILLSDINKFKAILMMKYKKIILNLNKL